MKRTILGLAAVTALALPAATAQASQDVVHTYPVWCETVTFRFHCGQCVEVAKYTNCTYWM